MTRYKVIAPVVICKSQTPSGLAYKHLQKGAPVPPEAPADWIRNHLRDGMIAEVPEPEPPAPPPPPKPPKPAPVEPLLPPDPEPAATVTPAAAEAKGGGTRRNARGG